MNSMPDPGYTYTLVDNGFEIINGPSTCHRPLYGPHCRDRVSAAERVLAIVGDRPDALMICTTWWTDSAAGGVAKLGHLFIGWRGGQSARWFYDFATIRARYVPGHQEYELSDPCVNGSIGLAYVRPVDFEGLLVHISLPREAEEGEFVIASGGAQPFNDQGGRGSSTDFFPDDCAGTRITISGAHAGIDRPQSGHDRMLTILPGVATAWKVADARRLADGPEALLASDGADLPIIAGQCAAAPGTDVYLVLTTDSPDLPEVQAAVAEPGSAFAEACAHYTALSRTADISTPDPYLNMGFAAQVLAQDANWHDPTFIHGPWSWTMPYSGWRMCYGATVLGWHERVQSSTSELFPWQVKSPEFPAPFWDRPGGLTAGHLCRGAVPDIAYGRIEDRTAELKRRFGADNPYLDFALRHSYFYNMGEVLVDHILYDWEWTGDTDFIAKAFDFVADKLLWEERCLDADGDGLYENWLNTWVSDAHWYNGGGCIQASVYNWRANSVMADIARRLGKDPAVFEARAARIREGCDRLLWVPEHGVYAEYRDAVGRQRRHNSPEQASIYHPIDFWFCDDFQSYQMLRFSEYAIPNEIGTTPRGGRLVWSSNWLPEYYSSHGLYPQETINLMLCYYRLGLTEQADALLRGIEASFFNGPCPGAVAHNQQPDGSHFGSLDFSDTTSIFVRAIIEGLFGVQMHVPQGQVTIQPCFPRDWAHASLDVADVSCAYTWDGATEKLIIRTPRPLRHTVRLMARSAAVSQVLLAGKPASFHIEPGIGRAWLVMEAPAGHESAFEITYGKDALPSLVADPVAACGQTYALQVSGGHILEVRDPQGVLAEITIDGSTCRGTVAAAAGWHTFFILVESGDVRLWLPVDVEVRPAVEIEQAKLLVSGNRVRCACSLRNNTQRPLALRGVLNFSGSTCRVDLTLPALGGSETLTFGLTCPTALTPGSNALTARLEGDMTCNIDCDVVDWGFADRVRGVPQAAAAATTLDLSAFRNQELQTLHDNSYLEPRPATYSMMVEENGRPVWDHEANAHPDTSRLHGTGGIFISDIGVPFAVPETGDNACVVSIWENFPTTQTIPVNINGRKLYFLLAVATNPMQSRIENARITVTLAGGCERHLALVNPTNLDDWLSEPYAEHGFVQYLGQRTHALILDMDLGEVQQVASITLECLSNEVLVSLLGISILPG